MRRLSSPGSSRRLASPGPRSRTASHSSQLSGNGYHTNRFSLLGGVCHSNESAAVVRVIVVRADGQVSVIESLRMHDLLRELWPFEEERDTHLRSMRMLNDFSKKDFLIRLARKAILVRTDIVRAVIEYDRVVFFDMESPTFDRLLDEFVSGVNERDCPFNFWAVECVVCAHVTLLNMRLRLLRPVFERSLKQHWPGAKNDRSILGMYALKMSISKFVEQVRPLVSCLRGLLEEKCHQHDERVDKSRRASPAAEDSVRRATKTHALNESFTSHDSTEVYVSQAGLDEILEPWAQNAEELLSDALEMEANVEDASRFLEASMSYFRNRLLKLELTAMTVTIALGFGSLVAGVFGMNLKSGLETLDDYFVGVTGFILIAILIICSAFACIYWRSAREAVFKTPEFGNNNFFRNIGNAEYVLSMCDASVADSNGELQMRPNMERVLHDLRMPATPMRPEVRSYPRIFNNSSDSSTGSSIGGGSPTQPLRSPLLHPVQVFAHITSPSSTRRAKVRSRQSFSVEAAQFAADLAA